MAVLAAAATIPRKVEAFDSYPVLAATRIYKGSLVNLNAAGYAIPAKDDYFDKFRGVAMENVLGGTASGDKWIRVFTSGLFKLPCTSITQAMVGDRMYVVDSGCVDNIPANVCVGTLVEYVSATEGWVEINAGAYIAEAVKTPSPFVADNLVTKAASYTVLPSDSTKVFAMATDALVFTLPSCAPGLRYTFINTGADGNNNVRITPAAADGIGGAGLTGVVAKYLDNTKGTAIFGDYVTIVGMGTGGIGALGWLITKKTGIWAKEA